jgi:hypothetical protein
MSCVTPPQSLSEPHAARRRTCELLRNQCAPWRFGKQMSVSPCADLSQCDRGHFQGTVEPPFGRGRQIRTVPNAGASIPLMSVETLIVLGVIVLVAVVITAVAAWMIW